MLWIDFLFFKEPDLFGRGKRICFSVSSFGWSATWYLGGLWGSLAASELPG